VVPLPPDPANTIPRTDAQFTPLAQVDSNADFIDKKSRVVPSPAVSMKRSEGQTPAHSPASDKKEDFTRNIETDKKPVLSASPPGAAPTQAPTAIQRKTEKKATDIGRNPGENSLGSIQLPSLPDTANRLQKLYSSVDPIEIAQFALEKKAFDDALAALASLPENHPKSGIKTVLMLDIYRKTGKFQDAKQLIDRSAVDVAEFDLAVGKIYMDMGNYQKAVQYFNQTQEKKCLSPDRRQVVIEEALYCCARASQKLYEEDKSQLTLEAARDAWNNLKKNLSARTGDPRYKEAVDILSKL
jgi:tetratricopeptide (TPR) repeat protein